MPRAPGPGQLTAEVFQQIQSQIEQLQQLQLMLLQQTQGFALPPDRVVPYLPPSPQPVGLAPVSPLVSPHVPLASQMGVPFVPQAPSTLFSAPPTGHFYPQNIPGLQPPMTPYTPAYSSPICQMCRQQPVGTIFLCGHATCCVDCSSQCQVCVTCNMPVTQVIKF
jgi:hypothetical protein